MKRIASLLLAACLLAAPQLTGKAQAEGFALSDFGARGTALAGGMVARADDPSVRSVLPLQRYKAHKVFDHLAADDQTGHCGRVHPADKARTVKGGGRAGAAPHIGPADVLCRIVPFGSTSRV